jgi:hypothetical protein
VNRYVVKRDAFNSIFSSSTQRALIIEQLIKEHRITLATARVSSGAPSPKPQGQFTWPDGERRRSMELTLPRKDKVKILAKK